MIIGIILFVVAIGGTVVILATQVTVGELQQSITGTEIVSSDSELYDKTVLDAVKGVLDDVQNFDTFSLKTLYEHYGIKLLNGISGIDFTDKDFYTVPIPDLVNDLSIVINSFTLDDVSKIAGVDFASYNLPILTENLDNNISTAVDNILGSLNGDLTIREIKDKFGIDLGIDDNALMSKLQDVLLSQFGNVINVLRVSYLLDADTDTFIQNGSAAFYVQADEYVLINETDLANPDAVDMTCSEQSLIGGLDTDSDGTADRMRFVETRYVKKNVTVDGVTTEKFVVDNSSYAGEADTAALAGNVYRHVIYKTATTDDIPSGKEIYIIGYANRIDTVSGSDFTLVKKGFFPISELDTEQTDIWTIADETIDKDSKLTVTETATSANTYKRVHVGASAPLLQAIAPLTVNELQNADNLLDNLTIGDVIEINEDTARIIRSLAARNCKIRELGTVANELTLAEMIDITNYSYEESAIGKYVRIFDETSYTLYDKNNADYENAERFSKNSDGTYTPDANGKFVHSIYYTVYNPALHEGFVRYNRLSDDGTASSSMLQRFAGATLGSFSTAFDSLMLSDVLDVDPDIYAKTDMEYINAHTDERFFYYDTAYGIFRVANDDYITANPSAAYYRIAQSGNSTAIMKKLAYVKVDGLSDAMEVVIDDMMLSEFIDVYTESAVNLGTFDNNFDENKDYFIEFNENGNSYVDEKGTKYVYVYDIYGDYAKANFRPVLLTENLTETSVYYTYKPYTTLGSTPEEVITNSTQYTAKGNLYYLDGKTGEYTRNMPLCTYMLTRTRNSTTAPFLPYLTGEYHDELYYREIVTGKTDADVDNVTVFKGTVYSYTGTTPEYGIYVRDNFRGYLPHIENDPAFADQPLYTFEKSATAEFIVNKDDVSKLYNALKDCGFVSPEIYYARRQCENVYVKADNGEFVFVDGQYVPFDAAVHSSDIERYDCKIGYIGVISEVSYLQGNTRVTEFDIKPVDYIREKSSPVLRLLSRGTISEMTNIIGNAMIGDIIEAEPGSLFDNEMIKSAKLSELGTVFGDLLTNMTISDLLEWSHVTDVDEYVKRALEDITIQNLFSSLVLDETTNEIKLDMLRLYGYTSTSATSEQH